MNLTHLEIKEILDMNLDMIYKEPMFLVERYNEDPIFIIGTRYEINVDWINIFKEDQLVSSFREEDIKSILLT